MKNIYRINRVVWDWIEENLNKDNYFDLVIKPNNFENVYLCWKGTDDLFATINVSKVKRIILEG